MSGRNARLVFEGFFFVALRVPSVDSTTFPHILCCKTGTNSTGRKGQHKTGYVPSRNSVLVGADNDGFVSVKLSAVALP